MARRKRSDDLPCMDEPDEVACADRLQAIELAAERARARTCARRAQPLVGAAVKPLPPVEFESVPLPSASPFCGSTLGGRTYGHY